MSRADLSRALRHFAGMLRTSRNSDGDDEGWDVGRVLPDQDDLPWDQRLSLVLTGSTAKEHHALLARVRAEPLTEHLSDREIDELLWQFAIDVSLPERVGPTVINQIVRSTADALLRPWKCYEVIAGTHGFTSAVPFRFANVDFAKASPKLMRDWGIWDDEVARPKWRGHGVATVRIAAGNDTEALRRGRIAVERSLAALQVGLQAALYVHLWDDQLRSSAGWLACREQARSRFSRFQLERRAPRPSQWNDAVIRGAIAALEPVETLLLSGRETLIRRVEIALEWLKVSHESSTPSLKLLATSSALESLLATRSHGLKGGALATRSAALALLLDGHARDPGELFLLYETRSDLAHGQIQAVDDHSSDTVRSFTERALVDFCRYANSHTDSRTHGDLLAALSRESTPVVVSWIKRLRPVGWRQMLSSLPDA